MYKATQVIMLRSLTSPLLLHSKHYQFCTSCLEGSGPEGNMPSRTTLDTANGFYKAFLASGQAGPCGSGHSQAVLTTPFCLHALRVLKNQCSTSHVCLCEVLQKASLLCCIPPTNDRWSPPLLYSFELLS